MISFTYFTLQKRITKSFVILDVMCALSLATLSFTTLLSPSQFVQTTQSEIETEVQVILSWTSVRGRKKNPRKIFLGLGSVNLHLAVPFFCGARCSQIYESESGY
jgi:hypothetical protein